MLVHFWVLWQNIWCTYVWMHSMQDIWNYIHFAFTNIIEDFLWGICDYCAWLREKKRQLGPQNCYLYMICMYTLFCYKFKFPFQSNFSFFHVLVKVKWSFISVCLYGCLLEFWFSILLMFITSLFKKNITKQHGM